MIDHNSKVKIIETKIDGEIPTKEETIWSEDGIDKLVELFSEGKTRKEISQELDYNYQYFTQRLQSKRRRFKWFAVDSLYKYFMLGGTSKEFNEYFTGMNDKEKFVIQKLIESVHYREKNNDKY
jgi:hypothetical protein